MWLSVDSTLAWAENIALGSRLLWHAREGNSQRSESEAHLLGSGGCASAYGRGGSETPVRGEPRGPSTDRVTRLRCSCSDGVLRCPLLRTCL